MEAEVYKVTLELIGVEPDCLEEVADVLYGAGFDDALVFATGGVSYIELNRKAVSGFDAILGAQVDIKKAGYNTRLGEGR